MPASTIEKPAPSKLKRAIRNTFTPILPMAVYRILKFRIQIGHFPNLRNPKSYNEKLLYKTLYDRREILTLFADKYRVRDYVRQKVGGDITFPETYAVYENWQDITLDGLPPSFVMKPNHGSGWALLVRDGDVPDVAEIRRLARQWLSGNFYTYTKEWCYQSIKPVILFEEFLTDRGERPDDVKFWCFNGKPDLVRFRPNPVSGRSSAFYDANWNKVYAAYVDQRNAHDDVGKPAHFDAMCLIAERLSADTDMVRVDLYGSADKIYFGELTNYPGNGFKRFNPVSFDLELGRKWQVPRRYVDK